MMNKDDIKQLTSLSKRLRLLYVEDDKGARATTLEMLHNFFQHIVTASDGEEGLNRFRNDEFDLIITDINMPRLNGLDMLAEIRKTDATVPVMILSAYNEADYFLSSIKLGVDGYILKPVEHIQFLTALSKIIEKVKLQKENENYRRYLEHEVDKQTQEIRHKLHFDDLTGLLSRYSFFEDIKETPEPSIFIIDIDKFKIINEIYGTETGSLVLRSFADFLTDFIAGTTFKAYRLSGDEFILWDDTGHNDKQRYEQTIEHFFEQLASFKVQLQSDYISIDVTIGVSMSQSDAFESAKVALDYAKTHKKPYAIYSLSIDRRVEEQGALQWKDKIKSALKEQRILPVYQPIVDQSGHTVKYEALMRLKEAGSGALISPYFFLDTAVKTRLYPELSETIIFKTLELISQTDHTCSINIDYSDITNQILMRKLEQYIALTPQLRGRIVFEITESQDIEDYEDVKAFIEHFRQYDVKIAIDDFGSGFSNFQYILELHPDFLKLDGSLIKSIDTDTKSQTLVSAIVHFSHELGIRVIAEHVHSESIFNLLKSLGVDEYQGYYFSEPIEEIC